MVKQTALLDACFAALADPTRRAILERLTRGDATVTVLAEPFAMSLPAISKHLNVLEDAGFIAREREGRQVHVRLLPQGLRRATSWLDRTQTFWESRLDRLERHLQDEE